MAIHGEFAELILAGTKRVEFRKAAFRRPVSHVFIYATAPVARVVGYFEVAAVDEGSPPTLWRSYSGVAGIDYPRYRGYFAGHRRGVAIRVKRAVAFERPIRLGQHGLPPRAPQNFAYVNAAVVRKLRAEPTAPNRPASNPPAPGGTVRQTA